MLLFWKFSSFVFCLMIILYLYISLFVVAIPFAVTFCTSFYSFLKALNFSQKKDYTLLIKDINFPLGIIHTIHIPLSLLLTDCIHISGGGWCQHRTTICVMLWGHCTTPADNMSQSVKSDRPSCRNSQCRPIPSPSSPS